MRAAWILFLISFNLMAMSSVKDPAKPLKLKNVISQGLEAPVFVVAPEKDWYIVDQPGRILKFAGRKLSVVLDIQSQVDYGGEMGLLGLAFHPECFKKGSPHEGRYFINFTSEKPADQTVIREYSLRKKGHRDLLTIKQPYRNHNGGHLEFGPDGFLYIAVGDGGAAADPHNHGQNTKTLLGNILRIDVNGKKPYGVPKDNPFVKGGGRAEIFAWGLRNPWRFSFDPKGRLFAADVGQYKWEEVHIVERGKNYGWRLMEGNHCFNPRTNCKRPDLQPAIFEYGHEHGQSITGGYFYRGKAVPQLKDTYVVGDYGSGRIWGLKEQKDGSWKSTILSNSQLAISSFGETAEGELLVVSLDGEIHQFVP